MLKVQNIHLNIKIKIKNTLKYPGKNTFKFNITHNLHKEGKQDHIFDDAAADDDEDDLFSCS